MDAPIRIWLYLLLAPLALVLGQGQQCYFGPGAQYRAPPGVMVPCSNDGPSACCRPGDTCLSGNACYNYETGDLYQYGCTDVQYQDSTCPFKCGFDPDLSPWTALEYCGQDGVENTWVCHSPESCGCQWNQTYDLLVLPLRGCQAMGSQARVALYAPESLAPWVSLPSSSGGTTAYYSTTTRDGKLTWISTAIKGYTPDSIGPYVTYSTPAPTTVEALFPDVKPEPSTLGWAHMLSVTPPAITISGRPSSSTSSAPPSSPTSTSSKTSDTTSTPTTTPAPIKSTTNSPSSSTPTPDPSSLSTGAKAGIGIGVAGGVCLLAAIALILLFRRRRAQQKRASTGSGPDEKYASWQNAPYPPPNSYSYNQDYQYQGLPGAAMIHEANGSPEDERTVQKRMSPLRGPPPVEMEGEYVVPEMESRSPSRFREGDIAKTGSG